MQSRIRITDLRTLLKRRPVAERTVPWIYLGSDLRRREAAERLLGPENRLEAGPRLSAARDSLRQPFLDLVAAIGARQTDPLAWWSSRLSWRMWTTSDLFLLVCRLAVARDLAIEAGRDGGSLVIVVEDRWLLRQIREILGVSGIQGTVGLAWAKIRLVLFGVARRAWWLWKTLRDHLRQRLVWPSAGWTPPSGPAVAVWSYPLWSSIRKEGGWEDPHLPGLDRILQAEGWQVLRFSPPDCGGFEKELAARASYFRPLILFATPQRILHSLLAVWRPRWPESLAVDGLPVRWLFLREWWLDLSRASFCGFRLYYETLEALLSRGCWRWIATSYENQPWEKMIALAAVKHRVRICGIQTAILSPDYLPYVLGRGEAQHMPLPDLILTSGPYAQRVLAGGGTPPERLRLCGAIRYRKLQRAAGVPLPRSRILIVLPIHPPMCDDLLEAVRRAFPDGGKADGLTFQVRPHPLHPVRSDRLRFPAEILPSTFQDTGEALRECGLVLFTGSTVGFEAMARGLPVLRYRPETTLDVDQDVYGAAAPSCGERDLREALLELVQQGPPAAWEDQARDGVTQLFAPFNVATVRAAFTHGKIGYFGGVPLDDQRESIASGKRPQL